MQLPREVIVGVNILDRVGEICTKEGFHGTALVVSGPVTYPLAGVGVAKSAEHRPRSRGGKDRVAQRA